MGHTNSLEENQYFLEALGVKWYLTFNSDMSQVPNGANKLAYLRVPTNRSVWDSGKAAAIESLSEGEIAGLGFLTRSQIQDLAQSAPGSYWYVFGEVNRYGYMNGTRFAPVFHYFMTWLKAGDPTAKVLGPSILNWDFMCVGCGGYQLGATWLAAFIGAYESEYEKKPPVDAWAIDVYPIDWNNTPNNDPAKPAFYAAKGQLVPHWSIAVQQVDGLRSYLDDIPEYEETPIWVTELSIHVGYDAWKFDSPIDPVGKYHWDLMADYLISVLDWLDDNRVSHKIERWFLFITWVDIVDPGPGAYMGITLFDDEPQGSALNCLGETYRALAKQHEAVPPPRVTCDTQGNTIPAP